MVAEAAYQQKTGVINSRAMMRRALFKMRLAKKEGDKPDNSEAENPQEESSDSEYYMTPQPWALFYNGLKKKDENQSCIMKTLSLTYQLIILPLNILMYLTIPDVRYRKVQAWCNRKIYIVTFINSIVWIAVYSWLLVWWVTRFGETWNIDSTVMGLTVSSNHKIPKTTFFSNFFED